MRKYILVLTMLLTVLLTACGSPENKFTTEVEHLNDDTLIELSETINQLNSYEEESSKLVSDALSDDSLSAFKDENSELYQLVDKRQEAIENLSSVRESIDEHSNNIANIKMDELDDQTVNQIKDSSDSIKQLSKKVTALEENYQKLLDSERDYFTSLGQEDADYKLMTDGMSEVNELYNQVQGNYQEVDDQLQSLSNKESDTTATESTEEKEVLYQVDPATSSIVPINDDTNAEVVLLTIDDAPDQYTLEMAQTLKELEAPAIFFVNGMFLESEEGKSALKEIHELGFEIGNHTYNHFNLNELTPADVELEIVDTSNLIEEVIGEKPKFFRAPFWVNNEASIAIANDLGMTVMNWTYGYDWEPEYQEASALSQIMTETDMLDKGANLLMHDRQWTNEALGDIVAGLRDQGYELVDPVTIQNDGGVNE